MSDNVGCCLFRRVTHENPLQMSADGLQQNLASHIDGIFGSG
jgi:hypothetical protein